MTEYTIVGLRSVVSILTMLEPFLRLKKAHVKLARRIAALLPHYQRINPRMLLDAAKLVDQSASLSYSKKRRNTTTQLRAALVDGNHVPRND